MLIARLPHENPDSRILYWCSRYPPAHVWIGASVCNQSEADRDIPKLLAVHAAVRFLSIEPMLGPVDLTRLDARTFAASANALTGRWKWQDGPTRQEAPPLDWVICGGESGPKARPSHPDWFRSLRDQCAEAGTAFLFKQWGEFASHEAASLDLNEAYGKSRIGGWVELDGSYSLGEDSAPVDIRTSSHVFRPGVKIAGRLLDGREHNAFPSYSPAVELKGSSQ